MNTYFITKHFPRILLASIYMLLTACGGGGGSPAPTPFQPSQEFVVNKGSIDLNSNLNSGDTTVYTNADRDLYSFDGVAGMDYQFIFTGVVVGAEPNISIYIALPDRLDNDTEFVSTNLGREFNL